MSKFLLLYLFMQIVIICQKYFIFINIDIKLQTVKSILFILLPVLFQVIHVIYNIYEILT
jgi:hypothetical protein